ncbi:GNAT family N-acetyltransferase [Hyphomicrobium sp. xq]|uniref:GNAT family N-acetyltransferase n=1 Tax=Hyphomicrobium album TaxID=2665159 RepID=A0A6I3KIZ6_9HYPH|nr:GNAT family N-acetyltransferase [Hyphomicrobium album]MTD93900.1 GNAT family N-acetyltransferase [Hyphomicrobium album]
MIDTRNYSAPDKLKDGTPVTVRAIRAGDREVIAAAFAELDRESIYTRFFTYKKQLTEAELRQLTEVDFEHVVALVVVEVGVDGETLLGGGRYCSEQPLHLARSAELAFVTGDAHHGRGVASVILKHLVQIARDRGLAYLDAVVLAHNRAMLAVFQHSGLPMDSKLEAGVLQVRLHI